MKLKDAITRYTLQKRVLKLLKDENDMLGNDIGSAMRELYDMGGVASVDAEHQGVKIGTVSARLGKAKRDLKVKDLDRYRAWCEANGYVLCKTDDTGVKRHFEATGEVPDGCEVVDVKTEWLGITCRPDKKAIDGLLLSMMPALKGLIRDE